ncbi:MAG TPA: ABC transporter ATP-binding protein [Steroidobacteraceae bacterium]|jgi:branched-chain amino acid transport system ATP-binding protein|nr:ABC transporter ATP-binding protein [Steroidobacteraceae bacterium]
MSDCLTIDHVSSGYGPTIVLDNISFAVETGETVAILGRNGAGKTTLLTTIIGFTTFHGGQVRFGTTPIENFPIWRRSRAGIGLVPQEREIFTSLSVEENLSVSARGDEWRLERVYDLFPRLAERRRNRGNELSGGEQQMLAIGRALMGNPTLLLLDEPLEGLAPIMMNTILAALARLRRETTMTLLLVEQRARLALALARRTIVLVSGAIAFDGPSAVLQGDAARLARLVGVSR